MRFAVGGLDGGTLSKLLNITALCSTLLFEKTQKREKPKINFFFFAFKFVVLI